MAISSRSGGLTGGYFRMFLYINPVTHFFQCFSHHFTFYFDSFQSRFFFLRHQFYYNFGAPPTFFFTSFSLNLFFYPHFFPNCQLFIFIFTPIFRIFFSHSCGFASILTFSTLFTLALERSFIAYMFIIFIIISRVASTYPSIKYRDHNG